MRILHSGTSKNKKKAIKRDPKKPKLRLPHSMELYSTKLVGLTNLRKIIEKANVRATVIPYMVVRRPTDFSLNRFAEKPARVLVRTDVAREHGLFQGSTWGTLPRKTFIVEEASETEKRVRDFMQIEMGKNRQLKLFFIVHPLRPMQEYAQVGKIQADSYHTEFNFLVVEAPSEMGHHVFRNSMVSNPEQKPLPQLMKTLETIWKGIQSQGLINFEASFVTYKDKPNIPEFYDFLVKGKQHR